MAKRDKLLKRLQSKPKDFTYRELLTVMNGFGYTEIKLSSSARIFEHPEAPEHRMHKPHPKQILKRYQIEDVLDSLRKGGFL